MKTIIFRYTLYATALLYVLALLNWFLVARPYGYVTSEVVGYLSMILALSTIYLAIRHYRTYYGAGKVTFGQGLKIGILITVFTSALFFIFSVIYFHVWGDQFKAWADEYFSTSMPPEQYQQYLAQMEQMGSLYNNVWFQGLIMFLTVFFIGLIITLVSATVLKKTAS